MADRTLRSRYFTHRVDAPAGTPPDNPQGVPLAVFESVLVSVDVLIPSGHAGLTGLAFEYAGERVVPWGDSSTWLQGNDQTLTLMVGLEVSTELIALTYNEGGYDHAWYLRLLLAYVDTEPRTVGAGLRVVV